MTRISSAIFKTFFLSLCIVANTHFAFGQTASILPQGRTQFLDNNGKPLSAGKVYFYIPSTTTLKTTWQDAAETISNTNPVVLDAGGRATIYGDGSYRMIVKDRNNVQIYDANTSSAGSGGASGPTVGDGLSVGSILPWSGMIAPPQYQFAYGQAVSRTTYSSLLSAITSRMSITCAGGSPILTNISDTSQIAVGTQVEADCLLTAGTVISKTSNTVTVNSSANIAVTTTGIFYPYGNGNGSTTFNLPDLRGYVLAGRCNMGGVECSNLNSTYFSSNLNNTPSGTGAKGGSQNSTLLAANLPPQTPSGTITITDPGHVHAYNSPASGSGTGTTPNYFQSSSTSAQTSLAETNISAAFNGTAFVGQTSTPFSNLQPTLIVNYVIKVTADSAAASTNSVNSIGGMFGVITCGYGVVCSGNSVSVSILDNLLLANKPVIGNAAGTNLTQGATSGNTTTFATTDGFLTPTNCVTIDVNHNLVDSGVPCNAAVNVPHTQDFLTGIDFTPNVTTSLTLSSSPVSSDLIWISFDGINQNKNTWSLLGNTITFNAAIPTNTQVVEVKWATSTAVAGVGSFNNKYGAVAAYSSDKRIFVSTNGNDSDNGLSSESAKLTLQAAVTAAYNGGTVIVGSGIYTLSAPLLMTENITVSCSPGATITQANAANLSMLVDFNTNNASNSSLVGCIIDGNRTNNANNDNTFCIYIGQANDTKILNSSIQNCTGYGIDVSTGLRPRIVSNKFSNINTVAISIITGVAQTGTNGFIQDNILTTPFGQHGILIVNSDYNLIQGNKLFASSIGNKIAPMTVNTSGATVTWNSGPNFANVSPGMFIVLNSGSEYLITTKNSDTSLTVNSSIGTLTNAPAIIGEGDLISIDSSSFNIVSDNKIINGATGGIVLSNLAGFETVQKNLINSNNVSASGEACISTQTLINGTVATDNQYVNNLLTNCAQSGLAGPGGNYNAAINFIGADIFHSFVNGNYTTDDQGSPSMDYWLAVSSVTAGQILIGSNGSRGTNFGGILGGISTISLSGWGAGAAASNIFSNGKSIRFTVTAGSGPITNPQVVVNTIATSSDSSPIYSCKMVAGTGTFNFLYGEQNSSSSQLQVFYQGTPVSASTYTIQCEN